MDAKREYDRLMESRKKLKRKKGDGVYYELHHIIPAHYFANEQYPDGRDNPAANHPSNLVLLTAKEHYIAHLLLRIFDPCAANILAFIAMAQWNKKKGRYTVTARTYAKVKEDNSKLSSDRMEKMWQNPDTREKLMANLQRNINSPENRKATSERMKDMHENNEVYTQKLRKVHSERMTYLHANDEQFQEDRDNRGSETMNKLWQNPGFVEDRRRDGSKQMNENWTKDWFRQQHSVRVKKQRNDPILDAPRKAGLDKYNKSPKGIAQKIETARKINGDYVFERPMSANSPISQERYSIAPSVYKWWLSVNHLERGSGRIAAARFFGYEPAVAWQVMIDSFRESGDEIFDNAKWRERFENNPQFAEAQQAAAELVEDL